MALKGKDRDEFFSIMGAEGVPVDVARKLLAAGATLHRLAELECSSEAADRDRVSCPSMRQRRDTGACLCRDYGNFDPSVLPVGPAAHGTVPRIAVQGDRLQRRVEALCSKHGLTPVFGGDPRGAVLLVKVPSGRTNDWGGRGVVAG